MAIDNTTYCLCSTKNDRLPCPADFLGQWRLATDRRLDSLQRECLTSPRGEEDQEKTLATIFHKRVPPSMTIRGKRDNKSCQGVLGLLLCSSPSLDLHGRVCSAFSIPFHNSYSCDSAARFADPTVLLSVRLETGPSLQLCTTQ